MALLCIVAAIALIAGAFTFLGGAGPTDGAAANFGTARTAITTWIWHFDPELADATAPTYRDLLKALPQDVRVCMVVGDARAEQLARRLLGAKFHNDPRLSFLRVRRPFGAWARDFYTPFDKNGTPHVLVFPRRTCVPRQVGAIDVPLLLQKFEPSIRLTKGTHELVGGDLLLTSDRILVGSSTVRYLSGNSAEGLARLRAELKATFGRKLLVIGGSKTGRTGSGKGALLSPYFHIDMFLTVLDDQTVLLGDPRLALSAVKQHLGERRLAAPARLGTFLRATQKRLVPVYQQVEAELKAAGFVVKRVPILHGEVDPATGLPGAVLNWNNSVVERRGDEDIAYIPRYGFDALDQVARQIWRKMGYTVHAIDCSDTITQGGGVRCLTNDLRTGTHTAP